MDNSEYNYCLIADGTDVGCVREKNEDDKGQRDTVNGRVAVVCDGMGGHVGGAIASHIAVETILDFLDDAYIDDPREAIAKAIDMANSKILSHAAQHPELTGMGSTCVLLLIRSGLVYIGHVGDSRIYLVRDRMMRQLTKDHSFVQTLVDANRITEEEAERHPRKNEITNALGTPNMHPATVREEPINPEAGDIFVLCSDGLSGMVSAKQIEKVVSDHAQRPQQRVETLIQLARQNGGLDNITVSLVEFVLTPSDKKKGKSLWRKGAIISVAIAIVCISSIITLLVIFKPWQYFQNNPHSSDADTVNIQRDTIPDEGAETGTIVIPTDNLQPQSTIQIVKPIPIELTLRQEETVNIQKKKNLFQLTIGNTLKIDKIHSFSVNGAQMTNNYTWPKEKQPNQIQLHLKFEGGAEIELKIDAAKENSQIKDSEKVTDPPQSGAEIGSSEKKDDDSAETPGILI